MVIDMSALSLLVLPMLAGLAASFALEQYALAGSVSSLRRQPAPALLLHTGTWFLLFSIVLLLVQRPWFAVFTVLAFQILVLLVNQAKYKSLLEPFIFQDFEYFTDAIKHPRLYLPFFGIGRTIAATLGFTGAVLIGLTLESPIAESLPLPLLVPAWLGISLLGLLMVAQGLKHCPAISCDPAKDLYELGQAAFFWAYWRAEKEPRPGLGYEHKTTPFHQPPPVKEASKLPDIVVVQSESFFDPRPLSDNIKPSVLEHFDQIKAEASHHGPLEVPAWGANTVRTECSFLSALSPEQLGIHRFNPYRLLAKQSIPNLAAYLKQAGYRTLCVHPYPASFYLRDRVFPRLGFDHFMDIASFNAQQKSGQFIADLAVSDKISDLLNSTPGTANDDASKPLFIFVITMENHGPLHLEQPDQADEQAFYQQTPAPGSSDLTVYLRHLKNADLMIKSLKDCLSARANDLDREGVLCWYGDHVPIMATVYELFAKPDGLTDYFIWKTSSSFPPPMTQEQRLAINELAEVMLKTSAVA